MAQAVILPKLGNTVESAIILAWHAAVGDPVSPGDLLCEVETDKATLEIESDAAGILLAQLCQAGEEANVLSPIAVVGAAGESLAEFMPASPSPESAEADVAANFTEPAQPSANPPKRTDQRIAISPRALNLARRKGIDYAALTGSGPQGRIIERDIEAALRQRVTVSPVAKAMLDSGDYHLPNPANVSQRVTKADLQPATAPGISEIPLKGIRKTIAQRMLSSLQTTAQLTLNAAADARALQAFRRRLKNSDYSLGLNAVAINDLLLFAVSRTLPAFPALNALFQDDIITQHEAAHLAMAVDTERGLLVPVIRDAQAMTLKQISAEANRLAAVCRAGTAQPDELSGGTFTVSNLGALGIESFTPVLNPPQVAILGIGSITLKPMQTGDEIEFIPHIGLSLTINHQVVDGAPAARFLQALAANIANIDILAAL